MQLHWRVNAKPVRPADRGRLIGVGVSMGGIVMANYAARISDKVLVRAGANTTIPEPRVVNT